MKKKMFIAIPIVSLIIIGIIFFLIYNRNDDDFLKLGDYTIKKSHFIYFSAQAYDEAYKKLNVSGEALWSANIEGKSTEQWIKDYAKDLSKRYLIISKLFDDSGMTLNDSDISDIEDTVYEKWHFNGRLAIYGPMGIDESTYSDIVTMEKKVEKLVDHYRDELDDQITEDMVKSYLTENYASFLFVSMSYFDEEGESTIDKYDTYCQQVREGKNLEALAREFTAEGNSRVKTSINAETERIDIAIPYSGSSFPLQFVTDLFQADIGSILYFDDTANMTYNIAERTDILKDNYFLDTYRDEITSALLAEGLEEKIHTEIGNATFDINNRNINRLDIQEFYD